MEIKLKKLLIEDLISDGLIVTRPVDVTIDYLNGAFAGTSDKIHFSKFGTNKISVEALSMDSSILDKIERMMNNFGWYPGYLLTTGDVRQKYDKLFYLRNIKTNFILVIFMLNMILD